VPTSSTEELKAIFFESQNIVIAPHVNPDADALGAALALVYGFKQIGKEAIVVSSDRVPQNLAFLPGSLDVKSSIDLPLIEKIDLGIIVDLSALDRLGKTAELFKKTQKIAIIDHHQAAEDGIGDYYLIDPNAAATCLILYRHWKDLGFEFSKECATCLLCGIIGDTGGFRFRNTTPECLEAANHLMNAGADIIQINEELWSKKPLPSIKMLALAANRITLWNHGTVATSYLLESDYEQLQALDEHTEGIVNELLQVDTVLVSALFRETRTGKIRVSVRSRSDLDVSAVCRKFGGGGHVNAAGCVFELPLEAAQSTLIPELIKCADSYSSTSLQA
jgi:phosphoesterase RecJ-like protein